MATSEHTGFVATVLPKGEAMRRTEFTDKKVAALKPHHPRKRRPLKPGEHYDVPDPGTSGLAVRVSSTGRKTFVLITRPPGAKNPTRRALGEYGALTLKDAREKASKWQALIKKGIDPRDEEERVRVARQQEQDNTFAAVAEAFIAEKLPGERRGREVERDLRRELLPALGKLPITEISDLHVLKLINTKKRHAPVGARNLLALAKRLFSWARDMRIYGLVSNPVADLRASRVIGEKTTGDRVLTDVELFALWRVAGRLRYPFGPIYRMLLLSGLRLNEAADAAWPEIDLPNRVWTIPRERMKARNSRARPHAVPLTDDMMELLTSLRRFRRGRFVFSTTRGEKPAWLSDKIKKEVDRKMLRTLRALARRRGEDPEQVQLQPWVNHDIRRTIRTNLSRLKISEEAREAVLAHVRPGIRAVYDHHDYLDEKREALELWATRLRAIVAPPPSNVVPLERARV